MSCCCVPDCSREAVFAVVFRADVMEQVEVCSNCFTAINFALDRFGDRSDSVAFYDIRHERSMYNHKEDK